MADRCYQLDFEKNFQAWLAIDRDGREVITSSKPIRGRRHVWYCSEVVYVEGEETEFEHTIVPPNGSIEK